MDTITLEIIKNYSIKEYSNSIDKQHNLGHVKRVTKNALWIAKVLNLEGLIDKNLLESACYLHDVLIARRNAKNYFDQFYNYVIEKPLNQKYIGKILERFNLDPKEKQILEIAIINHSYSIPLRILYRRGNLYLKILKDADSLDYISLERQRSLLEGNEKILRYLVNIYLSWIRKNIKKYLNFPELATRLNNGLVPFEI